MELNHWCKTRNKQASLVGAERQKLHHSIHPEVQGSKLACIQKGRKGGTNHLGEW